MLTEQQQQNLETHVLGMFQAVIIPEVTPNGYILAADQDGDTYPDAVTTHHLVELCLEISRDLTRDVIDNACAWFKKTAGSIQNPFLITTLAAARKLSVEDQTQILEEALRPNQRPSGFIDLYAGFLDGGSAFSTLWAIRVASLLDCDSTNIVQKSFDALDSHWDDLHRNSFKGFYYELSRNLGRGSPSVDRAIGEVLDDQDDSGRWDNSDFYTAYIIGNLLAGQGPIDSKCINASSRGLVRLFDLDQDATSLPSIFLEARNSYIDSAYLQLCMRSLISAIRYLRIICSKDMREPLASSLFGFIPRVYHSAKILDAQLKHMNNQYGGIKPQFEHLEKKVVESILKESPYERNVFIMMPFRHEDDERYERIVTSIKAVLEKHKFKGWMASDKNLANQLWDNVASFMLACKYGIAIFTRVERENEIRVKEFNPNVSLELGFFLSRGKKVLILKDKILPNLQTDLVGHLYEPFDLNKSGAQIPIVIEKWVQALLAEEKKGQQQHATDG